MVAEATAVAPGAEGLLFLPYLTGERTPHPDPLARGALVGLTRRHGRAQLTRAVLDGVGAGVWPDVATACAQTITVTGADEPDEAWRERYAQLHDTYTALYPALRDTFRTLAGPEP